MTALSNTCVFTFVNVDADLNLLPVPQVYPTNYSEDARYLAGYRRHQMQQHKNRLARFDYCDVDLDQKEGSRCYKPREETRRLITIEGPVALSSK
jgi:hypothetical protein